MISGSTQDILQGEWKETSMPQFPKRTEKGFENFGFAKIYFFKSYDIALTLCRSGGYQIDTRCRCVLD